MGRIYLRNELFRDQRVMKIARVLAIPKVHVVGALAALWCYADEHSREGLLAFLSPDDLDTEVGLPGFSAAVESVGWLARAGDGIAIPHYDEHLGRSQKERKDAAIRQRRHRNADVTRDKPVTTVTSNAASSSAPASSSTPTVTKEREKKSAPAAPARTTWLTPFLDLWSQHFGKLEAGKAAAVLRPIVNAVGQDDAVRRFKLYCERQNGDRSRVSIHRFAEVYRTVDQQPTALVPTSKVGRSLAANAELQRLIATGEKLR